MPSILYAALVVAAGAHPPQPSWDLPISPFSVVRAFEAPPGPYAAGHRGIDLAGSVGQPVAAAGPGVVSFSGQVAGVGVIVIRHGDLRTTYEPVTPVVATGATVAAGQPVGHLNPGHGTCGACLHFGLRRGDVYLDPMSLFGRGPVRLLPTVPPTGLAAAHLATAGTAGGVGLPQRDLPRAPPLEASALGAAGLLLAFTLTRRRSAPSIGAQGRPA